MKNRPKAAAAAYTLSWDGRVIGQQGKQLAAKAGSEIWITWRPRIVGGARAETITGTGKKFLRRGILLELLALKRRGDECVARYRVGKSRR
jgi:riboflavin biosynthesis pyrimidine reductase